MNKSNLLNNKISEKSNIALICISGMFAGFLVSRVALSISMFLFGINAIRDIAPRQWLRQKWWLLGLAWVGMYALSWFWSADKGTWGTRLEVKLPFLLLPLAFAFMAPFTRKQKEQLTVTIALMLLATALYSIFFLVRDPAYYIHGYKQSHILPTLPKEDHIRTSIAMALFIVWGIYAWPALTTGRARAIVGSSIVLLAIFLHILAAKSGLISFYVFLMGYGIYLAVARRKLTGLLMIAAVPVFVFVAVALIPTFRERLHYLDFTLYMMRQGDRTGIGDINRLMSYKTAIMQAARHPLTGVGTGDMMTAMTEGYHEIYPEVPKESVLLPHNQFLIVALGCGLPAMALFILWVIMPLFRLRRNRQSFFFFMVWLLLLFQLMIEPVLEVQFGVFVFLFFMLLQKHELYADDLPAATFAR